MNAFAKKKSCNILSMARVCAPARANARGIQRGVASRTRGTATSVGPRPCFVRGRALAHPGYTNATSIASRAWRSAACLRCAADGVDSGSGWAYGARGRPFPAGTTARAVGACAQPRLPFFGYESVTVFRQATYRFRKKLCRFSVTNS